MRTILAACVALSTLGVLVPYAKADVVVRTEQDVPYWRGNHEGEWHARHDWRDAQNRHDDWLASHCVRDWHGAEYCR